MELIFGSLAFLVSLATLYLYLLNSSPEAQLKFRQSTRAGLRVLFHVGGYALVLTFFSVAFWEITSFWMKSEPITRPEIVLLLMHFVIFCVYGVLLTLLIKNELRKPPKGLTQSGASESSDPASHQIDS